MFGIACEESFCPLMVWIQASSSRYVMHFFATLAWFLDAFVLTPCGGFLCTTWRISWHLVFGLNDGICLKYLADFLALFGAFLCITWRISLHSLTNFLTPKMWSVFLDYVTELDAKTSAQNPDYFNPDMFVFAFCCLNPIDSPWISILSGNHCVRTCFWF